MPNVDFSHKPLLTGERVTLRPVAVSDVPALREGMSDPHVDVLTGSVHESTSAGGHSWSLSDLEEIYGRWAIAADRMVWAIVENSSARVVGESVLNDLDPGNQSCGFRIWIAGATGRGLGTEATRLTMRHAFERCALHRVELEVYDFNPRARHVYEKVGFVHEGTRRRALRFDGDWIDAHLMSILAPEWAAHHGEPVGHAVDDDR